MKKICYGLLSLWMLLCVVTSATADENIVIVEPDVSIGIDLPVYPDLVRVPGYPVYYSQRVNANYFFYDGMYWIYQNDNWYSSSWYNGPWWQVDPHAVPLFILRIPVSYYRQPPVYFSGWQSNAPPRWGQHWGHEWRQRRSGWDRWKRASAPSPAPLPVYQRQYSGDRYPRMEQQQRLRSRNYHYEPRDTVVRRHIKQQAAQTAAASAVIAPAPAVKTPAPAVRTPAPPQKAPAPTIKTPAPAVKAVSPPNKAPAIKAPAPAAKAPAPAVKTAAPAVRIPASPKKAPAVTIKAPAPAARVPAPAVKAPPQKAPVAKQKAPVPVQKAPAAAHPEKKD